MKETIIVVTFREPPLAGWDGWRAFYFSSLAAIYDTFTPEQVGCKLKTLWNAKITTEHAYRNAKCEVRKEFLKRKRQKNPHRKYKVVG